MVNILHHLQEPADLNKQFPELAEDFHIPQFFAPDQFFSSVFRISSCGLQLWTHYDVSVGKCGGMLGLDNKSAVRYQ